MSGAEPGQAAQAAAAAVPVGQVGVTLEASITGSRAAGSARARPSRRSDPPRPYRLGGVDQGDAEGPGPVDHGQGLGQSELGAQPHSGEPNCHVPRPMTDTRRPQAST